MGLKWSLATLLACSYVGLLVHSSSANDDLIFTDHIADLYPASNPLAVELGKINIICNTTGDIYRHELLIDFESCMTTQPLRQPIILCKHFPGMSHETRITANAAVGVLQYSPGMKYYLASYTDSNSTHPSGAPCINGAKMAIIIRDPNNATDAPNASNGSPGGTDGLSSSDSPFLTTTHIIIIAVAISVGALIFCGVVLLIILLFVLTCRGQKRSEKHNIESNENLVKQEESVKDPLPKTTSNGVPKPAAGKSSGTKNGVEKPVIRKTGQPNDESDKGPAKPHSTKEPSKNKGSSKPSAGNSSAIAKSVGNNGSAKPHPTKEPSRNKGSSKPNAGNSSAIAKSVGNNGSDKGEPKPRGAIPGKDKGSSNPRTTAPISYKANTETISGVDGPERGGRENHHGPERSGSKPPQSGGTERSKSQQPGRAQGTGHHDKNKPANNQVSPKFADNDRTAGGGLNRSAPTKDPTSTNKNARPGVLRAAPPPPSSSSANRQARPSQSLNPTTRKNSNGQRASLSLTTH